MESFDRLWLKGSEPVPSPRELVFVIKHTRVVLSSIFYTGGGGAGDQGSYLLYGSIKKVIELPNAAGRQKQQASLAYSLVEKGNLEAERSKTNYCEARVSIPLALGAHHCCAPAPATQPAGLRGAQAGG